MSTEYIGAIDQGTTSTRFMLFDRNGKPVCSLQLAHRQLFPKPGWVEHDPIEILENTKQVIGQGIKQARIRAEAILGIGIANQRETTVIWNPKTGQPYCNAIVWQDTRSSDIVGELAQDGGKDRFREKTGLPLATYFSASKLMWALENIEGLRQAADKGEALFGNIDSWLLWWLTGGPGKGRHCTDVTNASRTMLMDLRSLSWDEQMLELLGIPKTMLPEILPSVPIEPYAYSLEEGPFGARIPLAGVLGDQQAALFGQACFEPGMSKNTYGTGCFLILNTGKRIVQSKNGLITTVGYQLANGETTYALEGSVAIAGALVQWLRDNLNLIRNSAEIEDLAMEVEDTGGIYLVPAFSGLFAPYWRSDARGIIVGLSRYITKAHIARAALEAAAFQTKDIYEAMERDADLRIQSLKVDGGMTVNELLMQIQADLLGVPVIRPRIMETTALGAAYAAGLGVGFWEAEDLRKIWKEDRRWQPQINEEERDRRFQLWRKAVARTLDWVD